MYRIGRWIAAAAVLSGGVHAATRGHEAVFGAPVEKAQIVVRDLLWQCEGSRCVTARESDSRPLIVCMAMAQDVGPVLDFSTGGIRLDAEALARCNAAHDGKASVSSR